MSYTITLHNKHHIRRPSLATFFRTHDAAENKILMISACIVIVLMALYVVESNTLMFLQRSIPVKEGIVLDVKSDVQGLEIQATQLQSSQKVQEAALSKEMVFLKAVSYVNAGDAAVAMVGTSR
ncbi:MAG: hypothetical protein NUV61_03385 [Candidatus Azambacteria bacterium]|nr:hypothetical protein [Candidatus Azambacteria bacterium]